MLASQFLSVVIDEETPSSRTCGSSCSETGSIPEDDFVNNNLYQDLETVCKLPQVLLSECTIRLASPKDRKRDLKQLRFEANVTPIFKGEPQTKKKPPRVIEDLLQGVEAVYSDEEEEKSRKNKDAERNLKCGVCGRLFDRSCSLAIHLKSHCCGPPEPLNQGYKCMVCGKIYSQRSVLKKHAAIHSGYRLRCKVCGINFTQRSSLLRHCKRIHGIKNDSDAEILSSGLKILEDSSST